MPTVNIEKSFFEQLMSRTFTEEQLEELCFNFGIEVEFKYDENQKLTQYSFEIASNRYDMLSAEGITRCLKVYLDDIKVPKYRIVNKSEKRERIYVKQSVKQIRQYCVGAILRDITFTQERYDSFIDSQDKLHQNVGRKRTLASIGTHDYDTVKGPFTYDARKPEDIKFIPLNKTQLMDGHQLMEFYQTDKVLKEFLPIIKDSPVYPVVLDANEVVCSLPPIINSDHSKISLNTKNVFIEVTATDLTKANIALNVIVSQFSQYCAEPFTVEEVEVIYEENNQQFVYPDLTIRQVDAKVDYINNIVGAEIPADQVVTLLSKMGLESHKKDENVITVSVDFTRSDVLHPCDIAEDTAIAYNYNNVVNRLPNTATAGKQLLVNKFTDLLRVELASAGYIECLNWALCSFDENTSHILRTDNNQQIKIGNPKTSDFQTGRIQLISGLLKTLKSNKGNKLPISLFEIGDIILKTDSNAVGAKNERHLAAIYTNHDNSELERIHGLLDFIMMKLNVPKDDVKGYTIKPSNDPAFFPKRQVGVYYKGNVIGHFGVLHPQVLSNFQWYNPASVLEINIEPIINDF